MIERVHPTFHGEAESNPPCIDSKLYSTASLASLQDFFNPIASQILSIKGARSTGKPFFEKAFP